MQEYIKERLLLFFALETNPEKRDINKTPDAEAKVEGKRPLEEIKKDFEARKESREQRNVQEAMEAGDMSWEEYERIAEDLTQKIDSIQRAIDSGLGMEVVKQDLELLENMTQRKLEVFIHLSISRIGLDQSQLSEWDRAMILQSPEMTNEERRMLAMSIPIFRINREGQNLFAEETDTEETAIPESFGYVSDSGMNIMEEWGLLSPPNNGTGTVIKLIKDYAFDIGTPKKLNITRHGENMNVEAIAADGSTKKFEIMKVGDGHHVSLLEEYKMVDLRDIFNQRFDRKTEWIARIKVKDSESGLLSALRNAESRGIELKDARPTRSNTILITKNGEVLAKADKIFTSDDWISRFEMALREAVAKESEY